MIITSGTTTVSATYLKQGTRWCRDWQSQLVNLLGPNELVNLVNSYIFREPLTLKERENAFPGPLARKELNKIYEERQKVYEEVQEVCKDVPESLFRDLTLGQIFDLQGDFVERILGLPQISRRFTLSTFNSLSPNNIPGITDMTSPIMRVKIEGLGLGIAFTLPIDADKLSNHITGRMVHTIFPAIIQHPLERAQAKDFPLFQVCVCKALMEGGSWVRQEHLYVSRFLDLLSLHEWIGKQVQEAAPSGTVWPWTKEGYITWQDHYSNKHELLWPYPSCCSISPEEREAPQSPSLTVIHLQPKRGTALADDKRGHRMEVVPVNPRALPFSCDHPYAPNPTTVSLLESEGIRFGHALGGGTGPT